MSGEANAMCSGGGVVARKLGGSVEERVKLFKLIGTPLASSSAGGARATSSYGATRSGCLDLLKFAGIRASPGASTTTTSTSGRLQPGPLKTAAGRMMARPCA